LLRLRGKPSEIELPVGPDANLFQSSKQLRVSRCRRILLHEPAQTCEKSGGVNYPQSNGKIERWHKSLKGECIRPGTPNSATGYITPKDMLPGLQEEIHPERDRKLVAARKQRQTRPQQGA
jgi:hypothetical protein